MMKNDKKYIVSLLVLSLLTILPAVIARICNASDSVMRIIAAGQLFMLITVLITFPISLTFCIRAALKNDWERALLMAIVSCLPFLTWGMVKLANGSAYEALMGI